MGDIRLFLPPSLKEVLFFRRDSNICSFFEDICKLLEPIPPTTPEIAVFLPFFLLGFGSQLLANKLDILSALFYPFPSNSYYWIIFGDRFLLEEGTDPNFCHSLIDILKMRGLLLLSRIVPSIVFEGLKLLPAVFSYWPYLYYMLLFVWVLRNLLAF